MSNLKQQPIKNKTNPLKNDPVNTIADEQFVQISLKFLKQFKKKDFQQLEYANVLNQLITITSYQWKSIKQLGKSGIGYEQIPLNQLKCSYPKNDLFKGIGKATVFHKPGNNVPIIGFPIDEVFYLFCLDRNYKAYKH